MVVVCLGWERTTGKGAWLTVVQVGRAVSSARGGEDVAVF